MRIRGYGQGSSGQSPSSRERTAMFRKRFRVGDMISGKLIRWESQDMGWVLIEGLTLLASISSSPAPGETLTFLVKSLTPDIVLQELHGQGGGTGYRMGTAVQDFHKMRSSFESKADHVLRSLCDLPHHQRQATFADRIVGDKKLLGPYLELATLQAAMNQSLAERGTARFSYAPWLVPHAREHESLYRHSGSTEQKHSAPQHPSSQNSTGKARAAQDEETHEDHAIPLVYHELIHCLRHRAMGQMQFRFLNRTGLTAYRLHLSRLEHKDAASAVLEQLLPDSNGSELRLLGVERIHKYAQGGVLTELLSPNVQSISGFTG